jgi:putative DNA primase/helicase
MWRVLDETDTRRRLSEFLCDVGDAKLEAAEVRLREGEGEADKAARDKAAALRKNLRSQTRLKAVWQTSVVHMDAAEVDEFDANPQLLGTPGGVIDLRTGEFRPATVGDMVTQQTAVTPASPGVSAPRLQEFLAQVFDGDVEMVEFIQRLSGSALVGDVSPQKFVVFYGHGANGKSVLRDVMGRLLGSYTATASAKVFMQSHSDRHPTEIASFAGKRLLLASEVPAGRSWNDTLLKDLTGGEKMTARRMHKDEFSFTPCATPIFTANTLPSFHGAQEAMLRRILLVEMSRKFSADEQDPNLAARLLNDEGPAILGWMIEGARKFLADGGGVKGLGIPQSITDATQTYFEEEDIVRQFLMEAQSGSQSSVDWSLGAFVSCSALLDEFNLWAGRNGHKPWTVRTLSKAIRENAVRYGLSDVRTNIARGFQVERRLAGPPTGGAERPGKNARQAAIRHLRAVDDERKKGDGKRDRQVPKRTKK